MLMLLTLVPTGTASNAAPSMPPSEEFTGCRKKVTVRPATWLTKLRFGAWSPAIGQQFVDTGRGMGADAEEHVTEIRERIDAVRLAGGDERIESGDVFAGVLVADKEVVLATKRDGAEGGFRPVVVWRDASVAEKARERFPVFQRVPHGDSHRALRRMQTSAALRANL
jgi:hypothetical protein